MAGWTVVPNQDTSAWKVVKDAGPSRPAGLPAGMELPGFDAHPAAIMQPSALGKIAPSLLTAGEVGKGVLKSIPGTAAGMGKYATIGKTPEQAEPIYSPLQDAAQTTGTAQAIGKGIGNAGQFLIPGIGEEEAAAKLATMMPRLGEMAAPLGRIGASAIGSGAVNKAQGGSFGEGAAAGGLGSIAGMGLKKLAPLLAESALAVRGTDRAFGRTPGQAILSETSGIKPGSIADQATSKVGLYSSQLDDAARQSPALVDLQPARDTADSWLKSAIERNNPATTKEVGQIGSQLDTRTSTGLIPQFVPAHEGLALRRGIDDLQTSWNPATVKDFSNRAVGATRNALAGELEGAIPGYSDLNSKISTLLPVAKRAGAADLNAGTVQRMASRLKTQTGALAGPIMAAGVGAEAHGPIGALVGGLGGLIGQEVLASPTVQMGIARAANSPLTRRAIPGLAGSVLQISGDRK